MSEVLAYSPVAPSAADGPRRLPAVGRPGAEQEQRPSVMVPISSLSPSDSPRVDGENLHHVRGLAELDASLPPITVHRPTMRVVDGMHRLRAAELRGETQIAVRFFEGEEADAFVLAVKLNATHGLPLSLPDRVAAAARIIRSHPQWSDRLVASATGLAAGTVASVRSCSTDDGAQLNARVGRDGRTRPLNSAEGRRLAGRLMAEKPDSSLREIAAAAGVALATVRDVRERMRRGDDLVPPKLREREGKRSVSGAAVTARGADRVLPERPSTDLGAVLQGLRRDPSLRFTEVGRALLRQLSAHPAGADTWERWAGAVPAHCAEAVAQVARGHAQNWLRFAAAVERRQRAVHDAPKGPNVP